MRRITVGAVAIVIAASVASGAGPSYLTNPDGEGVRLGKVIRDLMLAEFDCDAHAVDGWQGWFCYRAAVEVSIEGGAAGVRTITLQCPDLRQATGPEGIENSLATVVGMIAAFHHVTDQQEAADVMIEVMTGSDEANGGVFVLPLTNGMFVAAQERPENVDSMTVVFRDTEIAPEQAAGVAVALIEAVPDLRDMGQARG